MCVNTPKNMDTIDSPEPPRASALPGASLKPREKEGIAADTTPKNRDALSSHSARVGV